MTTTNKPKITKVLLANYHIHNSHNLASVVGSKLFISYTPADHGRLTSRYAYWAVGGIGFNTDPSAHWQDHGCKTFTVRCREDKKTELNNAKAWVKEKYNLDVTEKDIYGNWHITGTLNKLQEITNHATNK